MTASPSEADRHQDLRLPGPFGRPDPPAGRGPVLRKPCGLPWGPDADRLIGGLLPPSPDEPRELLSRCHPARPSRRGPLLSGRAVPWRGREPVVPNAGRPVDLLSFHGLSPAGRRSARSRGAGRSPKGRPWPVRGLDRSSVRGPLSWNERAFPPKDGLSKRCSSRRTPAPSGRRSGRTRGAVLSSKDRPWPVRGLEPSSVRGLLQAGRLLPLDVRSSRFSPGRIPLLAGRASRCPGCPAFFSNALSRPSCGRECRPSAGAAAR